MVIAVPPAAESPADSMLANARRKYLHVRNGGTLTEVDLHVIVTHMEIMRETIRVLKDKADAYDYIISQTGS
jgi:hypothetical protein